MLLSRFVMLTLALYCLAEATLGVKAAVSRRVRSPANRQMPEQMPKTDRYDHRHSQKALSYVFSESELGTDLFLLSTSK